MIVFQRRTIFYIIFIFVALLGGGAWVAYMISSMPAPTHLTELESAAMRQVTLGIGGVDIHVDVADNLTRRTQGLSGRSTLPENTGMLFVFDRADVHGIWMRDMSFPIDILWLNDEMHVVHIKEDADPASYPEIFYPSVMARYVLEVPAGFLRTHNITLGDQVWLVQE